MKLSLCHAFPYRYHRYESFDVCSGRGGDIFEAVGSYFWFEARENCFLQLAGTIAVRDESPDCRLVKVHVTTRLNDSFLSRIRVNVNRDPAQFPTMVRYLWMCEPRFDLPDDGILS
jgi:hypothetical protein